VTEDPATERDTVSASVAETVPRFVRAHALTVAAIAEAEEFVTETPGKTSTVLQIDAGTDVGRDIDVRGQCAGGHCEHGSRRAEHRRRRPGAPDHSDLHAILRTGACTQDYRRWSRSDARDDAPGESKAKRSPASFLKYRPRHPSKQREDRAMKIFVAGKPQRSQRRPGRAPLDYTRIAPNEMASATASEREVTLRRCMAR
jgi:hypothetical protein